MGFSENDAILLAAPVSSGKASLYTELILTYHKPYYYAVIPVIISSWFSDSELNQCLANFMITDG